MKKRGKAQIAMEYILIVTLAFVIIIPGVFLFRNYAFESNDKILERRLQEVSNSVLTKARKMYYYGPPSKSVATVEMPPQVENMYTLSIPANNEYYLVFRVLTTQGPQDWLFDSDVPLDAATDCDASDIVVDECNLGECKCFPDRFFSRGVKNFATTSSEDCSLTPACIIIDEISGDI